MSQTAAAVVSLAAYRTDAEASECAARFARRLRYLWPGLRLKGRVAYWPDRPDREESIDKRTLRAGKGRTVALRVPTRELVDRYLAGETVAAIGRAFGLSHATVSHRLRKEAPGMTRPRGRRPLDDELLGRAYRDRERTGESWPSLAARLGTNAPRLRTACRRWATKNDRPWPPEGDG